LSSSPSPSSNTTNNTSNSKRILLVDDEADVISLFKMVLEMNGFEVDALLTLQQHCPVSNPTHMV
jgi:PleD family two-component response regulator